MHTKLNLDSLAFSAAIMDIPKPDGPDVSIGMASYTIDMSHSC